MRIKLRKVGKRNKRKWSQVKTKVSSLVDWTGIFAQVQDETQSAAVCRVNVIRKKAHARKRIMFVWEIECVVALWGEDKKPLGLRTVMF